MNGELCARWYATGQPVRLGWKERLVSSFGASPSQSEPNQWLAPALIDLQINGFAGVDFQQDGLGIGDLVQAISGLRAAGCGRFLLTLITDQWSTMLRRLAHLRSLREQSPLLASAIAGWHLEGPFLSAEPGYRGAHEPSVMCDPSPRHVDQLKSLVGKDSVLLTLAPERPGAFQTIRAAVTAGFRVSLGHTNASADALRGAVETGASGFTHLGNACPQQLDRHDNILWRVLDIPGLAVSLIPDQIHVSPPLFRLVHRVLGSPAIYYTTDAMAAAGAKPGRYSIGRLTVEVGPDQIVRQPGKSNYAGSALRPIEGIFRAAQMLQRPWQEVWDSFSATPARLMGWPAPLSVGQVADFCVLDLSGPSVKTRTFVGGQEVS